MFVEKLTSMTSFPMNIRLSSLVDFINSVNSCFSITSNLGKDLFILRLFSLLLFAIFCDFLTYLCAFCRFGIGHTVQERSTVSYLVNLTLSCVIVAYFTKEYVKFENCVSVFGYML